MAGINPHLDSGCWAGKVDEKGKDVKGQWRVIMSGSNNVVAKGKVGAGKKEKEKGTDKEA
jgi:hypothetical protein